MIVQDQRQALCIACEMERRAIRTYERALLLSPGEEVEQGIREILEDEREHLRRFSAMKESCCEGYDAQERMLLSAMAADVLSPGGVMEMQRAQGLTSLVGLYTYARDSEEDAVKNYCAYAEKCTGEVREAFLSIAREEATHLHELERKLAGIEK